MDLSSEKKIVFSPAALGFTTHLHRLFNSRRIALLQRRREVQRQLDAGALPDFLESTESIRGGAWRVAEAPPDLLDRRVEITGPVDRKMMINALNSGARVFMADIEDSLSPTWDNISQGQLNLYDAVRRTLGFVAASGQEYRLNKKVATLVVRPRGWHLDEHHMLVEGEPISASLFDFGIHFFNNAAYLLQSGSGPYFYLPKLENHLEARLWNDVFVEAQKYLGLPQGSIRATVLIETLPAAFEMEEILYELRDHASGLNAGRWDYIFSMIKRLRKHPDFLLPDRAQVTMEAPFMRAYARQLVRVCHQHGAHAIGGMSAFIPNRKDPEFSSRAIAAVAKDKQREASDGFDGTWVAHPDLVQVATAEFEKVLGATPNQKHLLREDVNITARDLLATQISGGKITAQGVITNLRVAVQYVAHWLAGNGAVALNNLMEDAATAEISRTQIWQWLTFSARLDDGRVLTPETYAQLRGEALAGLASDQLPHFDAAIKLVDTLILAKDCEEFLTIPAYKLLWQSTGSS